MNKFNIVPIAYCPIARGADTSRCPNVIEHETILKMSAKYGKTGAQILLNWGLQKGHVVIPRSNNEGRLLENI
jgi:diketogulonate reductase-like aldo/keto reductase